MSDNTRQTAALTVIACEEEPQTDVMPVWKTIHYPWTDGSFKPLAYARIACIKRGDLFVDLQGFERDPVCGLSDVLDNSCLALSLSAGPRKPVLTTALNADGRYCFYENGNPVNCALEISRYAGDDEQGWYWGVRFCFPVDRIFKGGKQAALWANVFKFSRQTADEHMGAVAPMRDRSIFSPANLALCQIVHH